MLTVMPSRIGPIFKRVRGERKFCDTFKRIFGEDMEPEEEKAEGDATKVASAEVVEVKEGK